MKKFFKIGMLIPSLITLGSLNSDAQTTRPSDNNVTSNQSAETKAQAGFLNLKASTLGGGQFWTDLRHAGGWRIQRNSETGHHRLIDARSVRQAWGNLLHCQLKLDEKIVAGEAKLNQGKVVVLLHGLIRTKSSMEPMEKHLQQQGFQTVNVQYASTREKIGEHATALKGIIDNLGPDVTEINFICHSLGNIVVRRYLGDNTDPQTGQQGDRRIKRMVMLGPPNNGSRIARVLKSSVLFQRVYGLPGAELGRLWDQLEPTLATPRFEFGIIAGGQESDDDFSNFILKGKDDFTVSLEEAKLPGAHDLFVRPLLHSTMMRQPEVFNAATNFFNHGYFVSAESRQPIAAANSTRSQR